MDIGALFSLKGKTALITGASSGIGLHAARTLAAAGASVALAARRLDLIEQAASSLTNEGLKAIACQLDVSQQQRIAPVLDDVEHRLGARIDVLVNSAGILKVQRALDQTPETVNSIIDINLKGNFYVAQEVARRMAKNGGGAIVNIASTAALRAGGYMSVYAASKAGLVQVSKIMALELGGKGVRINVICPGNIESDMQGPEMLGPFREHMLKRTPLRRYGVPADLDGALLLLTSDAGRYMTGSVITVDGGQTLSWM